MPGFSQEWLSLREPVDHRSRNLELQSKVAQCFSNHIARLDQPFRVLDLGCGTGSNLRAMANLLPDFQHWILVDYDIDLLHSARQSLGEWGAIQADKAALQTHHSDDAEFLFSLLKSRQQHDGPEPLTINYLDKTIQIHFCRLDLHLDIEVLLRARYDLVTAAAFFDLVSENWIKRFCENLESNFYTTLTYNGTEQWLPTLTIDQEVLAAFHKDQLSDKGFGVAAGPQATQMLMDHLHANQFTLEKGSSPWILSGLSDRSLIESLALGSAEAVHRTRTVDESVLKQWADRNHNLEQCEIGHWDLWAYKKT